VTSPIEETIFAQLALVGEGKSIDPAAVAKAIDPEGWRRMLGQVRSTAVGLARQGKLVITRHGKQADPEAFKGVYRLRLLLESDRRPEPLADIVADEITEG
jgi:Protein of unknown function (DUF3253)